jgi:hypothetical protein
VSYDARVKAEGKLDYLATEETLNVEEAQKKQATSENQE